jgi:hypothetical protein
MESLKLFFYFPEGKNVPTLNPKNESTRAERAISQVEKINAPFGPHLDATEPLFMFTLSCLPLQLLPVVDRV